MNTRDVCTIGDKTANSAPDPSPRLHNRYGCVDSIAATPARCP